MAGYYIYRDGQRVAQTAHTRYTDTGLETNTPYTYTVSAFDASGNVSEKSLPITITTKSEDPAPGYEEWNPEKAYVKGDIVTYKGKFIRQSGGIKGKNQVLMSGAHGN